MNRLSMLAAIVLSFLPVSRAFGGLGVGDNAPALSISDWIKGEAIDLSKASADHVFVVEFWATWCPPCRTSIPHLTEMQEEFKDNKVTIVGISSEPKDTVKKFLDGGFDGKMRYTVAVDRGQKTNDDWMKASGQQGIPCAFVVKGGKIKWIGHPMDDLDLQVAEACGDKDYAERAKKLKALKIEFSTAAEAEKWPDAVAALDKLSAIDPGKMQYSFPKYHILLTRLDKKDDAAKFGRELVKNCDDAEELNGFAWNLLTEDEFAEKRDLELALKAAEKALALSKEKDASIIDTYAKALAVTGNLKGAVTWQEKAIQLCEDDRLKAHLEEGLKGYKRDLEAKGA